MDVTFWVDGKTESFDAMQAREQRSQLAPHKMPLYSRTDIHLPLYLESRPYGPAVRRLAFDFKGSRVGRLRCSGTRAGSLGRTGAAVASTSIATSGGAAKGERQEDLAGDATAREVARIERSLAKTLSYTVRSLT